MATLPYTSSVEAISSGILYGTASIAVSCTILGIDILLKEPIGIAMFIDAVVVGKSVDFFNHIQAVPPASSLLTGVPLMLVGLTIMAYTQFTYMIASLADRGSAHAGWPDDHGVYAVHVYDRFPWLRAAGHAAGGLGEAGEEGSHRCGEHRTAEPCHADRLAAGRASGCRHADLRVLHRAYHADGIPQHAV